MIQQDNQINGRDSTISMRLEDSQTKLNMVNLYKQSWVDDDELNQCTDIDKFQIEQLHNKEVVVE